MTKIWTHKNFTIYQFDELDSTNSHAFELANLGQISDHEIILSKLQKFGRGRKNRKWESPQGNLYFSLVLQPKILLEKIPQISFVAIASLRLAIEKIAPHLSVLNKWPNDLLINDYKVAGLLLESKISRNECGFVVLGIGVNLISNPIQTIFPASNLKNFDIEILPENLLKNFLNEFEMLYQNWLDFGFTGIRNLWLQKPYHFKEEITVKLNERIINGNFEDVDLEGNLLLKINGEILKISAADIL